MFLFDEADITQKRRSLHEELLSYETLLNLYFLFQARKILKCSSVYITLYIAKDVFTMFVNMIQEKFLLKCAETKLEQRVIFMHLTVKYQNVMKKPTI